LAKEARSVIDKKYSPHAWGELRMHKHFGDVNAIQSHALEKAKNEEFQAPEPICGKSVTDHKPVTDFPFRRSTT
jgi:hypothetical protein